MWRGASLHLCAGKATFSQCWKDSVPRARVVLASSTWVAFLSAV